MKISAIKYCICFWFEILHRYVFDNCYIAYADVKYKPLTRKNKILKSLYYFLWDFMYHDFREYLKWWHQEGKNKYIRYKNYEL